MPAHQHDYPTKTRKAGTQKMQKHTPGKTQKNPAASGREDAAQGKPGVAYVQVAAVILHCI